MRAFAVVEAGGAASIRELPVPEAGPGQLLVRVRAAGVNPIDWKVLKRPGEHTYPLVLGQDFAGVVAGVGSGVTQYTAGNRVFGTAHTHGAFADFTIVPEESQYEPVAVIPDAVSDVNAAALPTAGLTALASLEALGVGKGTTLLINGATGGVGGYASQIAHARGATVIGTVHSGKEDFARSLGIDDPVAYDVTDVVARIKSAHPGGIEALLDLVDDAAGMKRLATVVRSGGRVVSTIGAVDANWLRERGVDGQNIRVDRTPQSSNAGLVQLTKMLADGILRVTIGAECALPEAAQAFELSKSGKVDGKIVVTVA